MVGAPGAHSPTKTARASESGKDNNSGDNCPSGHETSRQKTWFTSGKAERTGVEENLEEICRLSTHDKGVVVGAITSCHTLLQTSLTTLLTCLLGKGSQYS